MPPQDNQSPDVKNIVLAVVLSTMVLLGFADFMRDWWWLVLLAAVGAVIGFRRWIAVYSNRRKLDLVLLKSPIIGPLLRDVAVARFTRTLGTLVSSGLPILDALRITRNTLGNAALMAAIIPIGDFALRRYSSGRRLTLIIGSPPGTRVRRQRRGKGPTPRVLRRQLG
mgnify:CR=1 FL=1